MPRKGSPHGFGYGDSTCVNSSSTWITCQAHQQAAAYLGSWKLVSGVQVCFVQKLPCLQFLASVTRATEGVVYKVGQKTNITVGLQSCSKDMRGGNERRLQPAWFPVGGRTQGSERMRVCALFAKHLERLCCLDESS